jgi:hypothetical protein
MHYSVYCIHNLFASETWAIIGMDMKTGHMGEETTKKDILTTGVARNMENKNY